MNKKKHKYSLQTIIFHVLAVVWMIMIFCFSAQPGDESADMSGSVSYMIASIASGIFHLGWEETKILEVAELMGYPIRKLAHMTEFGILSLLIYGATAEYKALRKGKRRWLTALLMTFLYAGTDEIHQIFVEGRYGCFTDVLIDTSGAVIALGILAVILALTKKNKI